MLSVLVPAVAGASVAAAETSAPVMIVLDASGSMNTADAPGPRIDAAKAAVIALVRALPAGARIGLLVYGTGTGSSPSDKAAGCRDIRVLAPVGPVDPNAMISSVEAVRARGYTPIGAALTRAADALPQSGPASIVLVSDGEDTCAPPDPCSVAAQLRTADQDLVVHTVGFRVGGAARRQLGCIAQATGGTYRDAKDGPELAPVLRAQVDAGLRPYIVSGTPIDGTSTPSGAPRIAAGQYADAFPSGGPATKYYSIALTAPETFAVVTTIVPPALRGGGTDSRFEVEARLVDADGDRCLPTEREHDSVLAGKVDPVTVVLSGVVGGAAWSKSCPRSGTFLVAVTRQSTSTTATGSETIVRFEPPVEPVPPPVEAVPAGLPAPAPTAPRGPCVGGASFDSAPLLAPGTCTDTLSTGETRYYRVRLGWGQRLAYQIVIDRITGADHGTGFVQSAVATPLRQRLTLASTSNAARDFGGPASIDLAGSTLVPAEYGNRNSGRSDIRPYALAGDYYLSLGMSYPIDALPYRTGVRVTVEPAGTASAGPHYLAMPGSATPSRTSPAASPSGGTSADDAQPSGPGGSGGGVSWLIGAAVVLAVGAVGLVARTHRRRSAR